jgi:hypothetical protein
MRVLNVSMKYSFFGLSLLAAFSSIGAMASDTYSVAVVKTIAPNKDSYGEEDPFWANPALSP